MKKSKSVVIAISIVLILAIVAATFAYLFFMTDVLKSNEELFIKYFAQNEEMIQKITDFQTIKVYENLKNENKYESNTNIKMIHSEGGEISNPLNNLSLKLDIQKNNEEQYVYADGQILYEDEEYLEAEIIKEKEIYGIRLPDAVKQFITIKKGENTDAVAKDIGIDTELLEKLLNIIDGEQPITTEEQLKSLKNEFINIIMTELPNGTFEKEKNTTITYNEVATKTNAYSVLLNSEQVGKMLTDILNSIKSKTEILDKLGININEVIEQINKKIGKKTVKITLYEQNHITIRTDIEMEICNIIIENISQNQEQRTRITYSDKNNVTQHILEIIKNNTNNQENCNIIINMEKDDENYKINVSSQMQVTENGIKINAEISCKQNITTISMVLENKINIESDFDKEETLSSENNFLISGLEDQKRKAFINLFQSIAKPKINEKINMLIEKLHKE